MLLIHCPHCGARPELEFAYAGEAHIVRAASPASLDDQQWSDYLYMRQNPKGLHAERWRHLHGCARFFNVLRDTRDDRIHAVYRIGQSRPDLGAAETNL